MQTYYGGAKPTTLNLDGKESFDRIDKTAKAYLLAKGKEESLFLIKAHEFQNILFMKKEYFGKKYGEEAACMSYE